MHFNDIVFDKINYGFRFTFKHYWKLLLFYNPTWLFLISRNKVFINFNFTIYFACTKQTYIPNYTIGLVPEFINI